MDKEYDITLTDGVREIRMVVAGPTGLPDMTAFQTRPLAPLAIKTSQGDSAYSDQEEPYFTIVKEDWTGGRGARDFENDKSKHFSSRGVLPGRSGELVLGGMPHYLHYNSTAGIPHHEPAITSWYQLQASTTRLATQVTLSGTITSPKFAVVARKVGSPGALRLQVWNDTGGAPSARRGTGSGTEINPPVQCAFEEYFPEEVFYIAADGTNIVSGCHVVLLTDSADASNYWEIGCISGTSGYESTDSGSTWKDATGFYVRVDDFTLGGTGIGTAGPRFLFFRYRDMPYAVLTEPGYFGSSVVYRIGDRGHGDISSDGSGVYNLLTDSTKTWVTNQWANAVVYFVPPVDDNSPISGLAVQERRFYRILSNTATVLTLEESAYLGAGSGEYVIVGGDHLTQAVALSKHVLDVEVVSDKVYFAMEDSEIIRFAESYRYGTDTFVTQTASEMLFAMNLESVREENGEHYLYGDVKPGTYATNDYVWRARVPKLWGPLYHEVEELDILKAQQWAWRDSSKSTVKGYANDVSITVTDSASGYVSVFKMDNAIDARDADAIVFECKRNGTVASNAASVYRIDISSTIDVSVGRVPLVCAYSETNRLTVAKSIKFWDGTAFASRDVYNNGIGVTDEVLEAAWDTATDAMYIGSDQKFDSFYVTVGNVVNTVAATMTVQCVTQGTNASVSNFSDGTASAGKTLAQNGKVSFTPVPYWAKWTLQTGTNAVEAYWVRMTLSAAPSATAELSEITVGQSDVIIPMTYVADGDSNTQDTIPDFTTAEYVYVCSDNKFNSVTFELGTGVNTNTASMTGQYWAVNGWQSLTISSDGTSSASKTFNKTGTVVYAPPQGWVENSINSTQGYWVRFSVSANLSGALDIKSILVGSSDYLSGSFPANYINEWFNVVVDLPAGYMGSALDPNAIDLSSLRSIGVNAVAEALGALDQDIIHIRRVSLVKYLPPSYRLDAPITNLTTYREDKSGGKNRVWAATSSGRLFELQYNDSVSIVELGIEEIEELGGPLTAEGFTTNGVYLYFTLNGTLLQRYYSSQLDNIGPESGEGLPLYRRGNIKKALSYPGKVFVVIDGTSQDVSTYGNNRSSIMFVDGNSWYDFWYMPAENSTLPLSKIDDIMHFPVPGRRYGTMYVAMDSMIVALPVSNNPVQSYMLDHDSRNFHYDHSGWVITPWMYANMRDVYKVWSKVKVFGENLGTDTRIKLFYQLDEDDGTWTPVDNVFDTVPSEEWQLSADIPPDIRSKRIRWRVLMESNDIDATPKLLALLVEGYSVVPVKWEYAWRTVLDNEFTSVSIGASNDTPWSYGTVDIAVVKDLLAEWANTGRALLMTTRSDLIRNRQVVLQQPLFKPSMPTLGDERREQERWEVMVAVQDL